MDVSQERTADSVALGGGRRGVFCQRRRDFDVGRSEERRDFETRAAESRVEVLCVACGGRRPADGGGYGGEGRGRERGGAVGGGGDERRGREVLCDAGDRGRECF